MATTQNKAQSSTMWITRTISSFFTRNIAGEWGAEPTHDNAPLVVGTPNFNNDGTIDWSKVKQRDIPDVQLRPRLLFEGNILVEKSGGSDDQPAGRVVYCDKAAWGTCSNFVQLLTVDEKFHSRFIFYLLYYYYSKGLVYPFQQKTTGIINFKVRDYFKTSLSLPESFSEQTIVAAIISAADEAINRTETLIAKLARTRQGIVQDLLTRGIDENGNIRSEETHQFKDSPAGPRIPETWWSGIFGRFLNGIGGLIQTGPFGSQLHAEEYEQDGFPVIMPQDINEGRVSTDGIARISARKRTELKRHIVRVNDVVIARRGEFTRAAPITEREAGWVCGTGCLLLRTPAAKLLGNWFALMYSNHLIQRQIEAVAVGSTMKNLNSSIMQNLVISLPDVAEQGRIVTAVSIADRNVEAMRTEHAKLQALKRGLMGDLLTGTVSVNHLIKQ